MKVQSLQALVTSSLFRVTMYLISTLGFFMTVVVKLSHGGVFGERVVHSATHYGMWMLSIGVAMWLVRYLLSPIAGATSISTLEHDRLI